MYKPPQKSCYCYINIFSVRKWVDALTYVNYHSYWSVSIEETAIFQILLYMYGLVIHARYEGGDVAEKYLKPR